MKQLTCEMCGGTDIIKQDGVFMCQNCGMKYSIEEAKKMMIEGTVDVQGTVKVDNSAFVEKYLANARRAKEKEDWEEVEKYYNMVEQNDPNNIEAIFYSAYGKAKVALTDNDIYKREAVFKVLKNCISILDDKYDVERSEQNKEAIISIAIDLGAMICSNFVFTEWKNGYGVVTKTNKPETISMFGSLLDAFRESINNIYAVDDQPYMHEAAMGLYRVAKATDYWKSSLMDGWLSDEKKMLQVCVDKLVRKEAADLSIDELFKLSCEKIDAEDYNMAAAYFRALIDSDSTQVGAYIGLAISYLAIDNNEEAVATVSLGSKYSLSEEHKTRVTDWVNQKIGGDGNTLLIEAARLYKYDAVKFLLSIGADPNIKNNNNITALWIVAHTELPESKAAAGRDCARVLLENGAMIGVKSAANVDLYNPKTDAAIKTMIREKFPNAMQGESKTAKSGGCYVATAVYGSYDCPQVWTLRRFRDNTLAQNWYGRAFIRTYYAISPTLVKWFGHTKWFKNMWRGKLDRMVSELQDKGVESTPYDDKNW